MQFVPLVCQLIEDLARFGAPALLSSRGEPLLRTDLGEVGACAGGSLDLACCLNERDIPGPASQFLEAMEKDVLLEKLAG
jgi:hypothetical protein